MSSPTLKDYLLPAESFTEAIFTDISLNPSCSQSTATHNFDPGERLDFNRLPYLVQRAPNMLERMRSHFEELFEHFPAVNGPISSLTCSNYETTRLLCLSRRVGSESTVADISTFLFTPVIWAYRDLTNQSIIFEREVNTNLNTVRTDYVARDEPDEIGQVRFFWENKSVPAFCLHAQNLQARLESGSFSLVGLGMAQHIWKDEEAILAKVRPRFDFFFSTKSLYELAWHATDIEPQPKWAIVFGGIGYFVVFIHLTTDDAGHVRPALFCSDTRRISDPVLPICSVMVYMALASDIAQSILLTRLGVSVPVKPDTTLQTRLPSNLAATLSQTLRAPRIRAQIAGGSHAPCDLERVGHSSTHPIEPSPILILDPSCLAGGAGVVYRCPPGLVVKFSFITKLSREQLVQEAKAYEHLSKNLHGVKVPIYYGLFRCGTKFAIILSDNGQPILSIQSLSSPQRISLLEDLEAIHKVGILHGDFVPKNIVVKNNAPSIIDFSHSLLNHHCPGQFICKGLIEAKTLLDLGNRRKIKRQ